MNRDQIIQMAREAGIVLTCDIQDGYIRDGRYASQLERFAALVAAAERDAWRNAAIRVGENLATCGPAGYYDLTSQQWLDWALSATSKMQDDYMQLGACGEREACAKVCEELDIENWRDASWDMGTIDCAAAIRARGETN